MKVTLKYGVTGLVVDLPETPGFVGEIHTTKAPVLADGAGAVARSLVDPIQSRPLSELARGKKTACIVISDVTRPVPNALLLPPILKTLEAAGMRREDILILVATGTHRPTTDAERIQLCGKDVARDYRMMDHVATATEDMVEVGKIGGKVAALVNRHYVGADLKILTGLIEPHMWAGYSGGRKAILPGISSLDTLRYMHGPEMIADTSCCYGRLEGNTFHEAGLEIMRMAGADFVVNVTLAAPGADAKPPGEKAMDSCHAPHGGANDALTGVFSGDPVQAHLEGAAFLARFCQRELDEPLDFVVTSNGGAPFDLNLYQTSKGIAGAAPALKPGGDILIASRCAEGVGTHEYQVVLDAVDTPRNFMDRLMRKEFFFAEQWCAQEMYKHVLEHDVWIYTEGLSPEELRRYHLRPIDDVPAGVRALLEKHGPNARWGVVPEGQLVLFRTR